MPDPLKHSARTLPEHMTPDGDQIAGEVHIIVFASGAMQISGNVSDRDWLCKALDQAMRELKANASPSASSAIVPASGSDLAKYGKGSD